MESQTPHEPREQKPLWRVVIFRAETLFVANLLFVLPGSERYRMSDSQKAVFPTLLDVPATDMSFILILEP